MCEGTRLLRKIALTLSSVFAAHCQAAGCGLHGNSRHLRHDRPVQAGSCGSHQQDHSAGLHQTQYGGGLYQAHQVTLILWANPSNMLSWMCQVGKSDCIFLKPHDDGIDSIQSAAEPPDFTYEVLRLVAGPTF